MDVEIAWPLLVRSAGL